LGVYDCLTGRNLMCYLGRGENEQEITALCLLLQKKLATAPLSIVTDYKPAWDRGIRNVFPETLLIRDGFHTVQLINQAIFKELSAMAKDLFTKPIKEIKTFYQAIKKDQWRGTTSIFVPEHPSVIEFTSLYVLLGKLYRMEELSCFIREFNEVLLTLDHLDTSSTQLLRAELCKRLPTNGLTPKNVRYYKQKLKGAFSLLLRSVRHQIEEDKKEFVQRKYILLKRPENLSSQEEEILHAFLIQFPALRKHRELSLRISNISHVPPETLTLSIITDIRLWKDAGDPLQAAVKTLKKNVQEIFNFTRVFPKRVPYKFIKKIRTGPEPSMRKIKDTARMKFGFRTPQMSQLYLEQQLQCQVIVI